MWRFQQFTKTHLAHVRKHTVRFSVAPRAGSPPPPPPPPPPPHSLSLFGGCDSTRSPSEWLQLQLSNHACCALMSVNVSTYRTRACSGARRAASRKHSPAPPVHFPCITLISREPPATLPPSRAGAVRCCGCERQQSSRWPSQALRVPGTRTSPQPWSTSRFCFVFSCWMKFAMSVSSAASPRLLRLFQKVRLDKKKQLSLPPYCCQSGFTLVFFSPITHEATSLLQLLRVLWNISELLGQEWKVEVMFYFFRGGGGYILYIMLLYRRFGLHSRRASA